MWFVRWAKTGSDEGLEVDLLDDHSLPISKSFVQLNVGNAIVDNYTPGREKFVLTLLVGKNCAA